MVTARKGVTDTATGKTVWGEESERSMKEISKEEFEQRLKKSAPKATNKKRMTSGRTVTKPSSELARRASRSIKNAESPSKTRLKRMLEETNW